MRFPLLAALPLITLAFLAGCAQPNIPDSGAVAGGGVGFGDYNAYLRQREAMQSQQAATNTQPSQPYSIPPETPVGVAAVAAVRPGAAFQQTQAALSRPNTTQQPVAQPSAPIQLTTPPRPASAPPQPETFLTGPVATEPAVRQRGVSDEQDFDAVAARETIESDAARLAQQRAQYQEIRVDSVPGNGESGGPNVMAYALGTQHRVGEERYRRLHPLRWRRWESACAAYRTQDLAQEAFLSGGGPDRDPDHLDPDGDGFACWWDPQPFREAARAAAANAQ
ncbi:hypothetical protein [Roseicitreum antarcticum]|uniref:Excalibur calcium-binding domain-containing protein n=1 Tax=Roseicitreum antarcticum TaxID=564137 RepID=A0A1H2VXZ5_9RHOB|nr:hypothetical protein [Roseicitreum antarcticum]SDW73193.1 hypothetical protein SAMN04488238_103208 [Roseicitreum antarcticum]